MTAPPEYSFEKVTPYTLKPYDPKNKIVPPSRL
jgi:hypothetical protein